MGVSTIRYVVYDSAIVNDSAWFIINWHVTAVGMNEMNSVSGNISACPNPANSNASIKYELSGNVNTGSLKIYNMLGSVIIEIKIVNTSEGTIVFSTADLEQGIYFYSIVANDKIIATRKLFVMH